MVAQKSIKGLSGEIIQIGAVRVGDEYQVLDTFDIAIKPVHYRKMNKYVANLTQITNADLAKGVPVKEAMEKFRAWCGEDFCFCTWGPDDIRVLRDNLIHFGLDDSWLPETYDLQWMFDDFEKDEGKQWALSYAMYYFDEKPDGMHTALADAVSTVAVLKHLDPGVELYEFAIY